MKRAVLLALAMLLFFSLPCGAQAAPGRKPLCRREGVNGIVCLTFDDGYADAARLQKVLSLLKENNIHCTFFIIGTMLLRNPDVWRQAVRDGHEICYHTMTHNKAVLRNEKSILRDIDEWNRTAAQVLGPEYRPPMLARLPGGCGENDPKVAGVYIRAGYQVVGWNVDPLTGVISGKKPGTNAAALRRKIRGYVLSRTKENSIILLHFDSDNVNALSVYIKALAGKYRLGRVSDALRDAAPPTTGPAAYQSVWESILYPALYPPAYGGYSGAYGSLR